MSSELYKKALEMTVKSIELLEKNLGCTASFYTSLKKIIKNDSVLFIVNLGNDIDLAIKLAMQNVYVPILNLHSSFRVDKDILYKGDIIEIMTLNKDQNNKGSNNFFNLGIRRKVYITDENEEGRYFIQIYPNTKEIADLLKLSEFIEIIRINESKITPEVYDILVSRFQSFKGNNP